MTSPIVITREDGRSNSQVLLDLLKGGVPGQIFLFEELSDALSQGTDHAYNRRQVQAAIRHILKGLAKTYLRTLHAVPNRGYRMAMAKEHMGLALTRQQKADRQYRMGLVLLENVNWQEMTENERNAHQGQLMISRAIYENQLALHSRMRKIEASIEDIKAGERAAGAMAG